MIGKNNSMTNIPSRYFSFVFTFTHHNAIPQILIDTWAIQNLGTWTTDRKLRVAQPKANLLLHCHWFASCLPNKRTILALFMQPSFLKFLPWIINLLFESNYQIPNDNSYWLKHQSREIRVWTSITITIFDLIILIVVFV